jgi:hypothetical protein
MADSTLKTFPNFPRNMVFLSKMARSACLNISIKCQGMSKVAFLLIFGHMLLI